MAFRKRFTSSRRRSFRRTGKPLARKQLDWVESLVIDPCNRITVPMCDPLEAPCCTTKWKMVLVDSATLEDRFSDRATVVRILGDLWIQPNPHLELTTLPYESYNRISAILSECFFGLKRGEFALDPTGIIMGTPTVDIWSGIRDDLSEFQWLKTWHHLWHPLDDFTASVSVNPLPITFNMNIPVGTDDTHTHTAGVETCNELATGSGFICIETDHSVDCESCPQTIDPYALSLSPVTIKAPRPWHVHFDVKKKIPLRENQELYLMFNGRNSDSVGTFTDFSWDIWGNLRTLIQTG